jgi:hypothetical protein
MKASKSIIHALRIGFAVPDIVKAVATQGDFGGMDVEKEGQKSCLAQQP